MMDDTAVRDAHKSIILDSSMLGAGPAGLKGADAPGIAPGADAHMHVAGIADAAASAQLANALKLLEPSLQGLALSNGAPPAPAAGAPPAPDSIQPRPPRRVTFDAPGDVDAAKKAVGAALAGLDLQTARVNLDASKAAVNAMRASGELPVHPPRKPAARSQSARQLNYTGANAANAPPLRHNLPLGAGPGAPSSGMGGAGGMGMGLGLMDDSLVGLRGGGAATAAAGLGGRGPPGARRAPPGRSISMPYVMHGRAGMQAQLASSLAQDAALQQQLHLLQGGGGHGAPPQQIQIIQGQAVLAPHAQHAQHAQQLPALQLQAGGYGALPAGAVRVAAGGPPGLGAAPGLDDSLLPALAGGQVSDATLLQLAGGGAPAAWAPVGNAAAAPQVVIANGWVPQQAPVQAQAQQLAQMQQLQAQLAAQQQAAQQQHAHAAQHQRTMNAAAAAAMAVTSSAALDGMWLQQQQQQQLPMPVPAAVSPVVGAAPAAGAGELDPSAALDSYSNSSWQVLALAHASGGGAALGQVAQELSLLAAACGALGGLTAPDAAARAVGELSLVAAAAQQHLALHAALSAPSALAVQLLAALVAPLCHARGATRPNQDLLEACFLMLETIAAASPELTTQIAAARDAARSASAQHVMGADAEVRLLKRQATAQQALAALAGFVERNQQLLLTMTSSSAAAAAAAAASAAPSAAPLPLQAAAGSPTAGGAAPGSAAASQQLSPARDTPLANFFAGGGASAPSSGPLDGLDPRSAGSGGAAAQPRLSPQLQSTHYSPLASPLSRDLPGLFLGGAAHHGAHHGGGGAVGAQHAQQAPRSAELLTLPHLAASMPLA